MDHVLIALHAGRPEHTPEAEPVVLSQHGNDLVLTLDDGATIAFDATELRGALTELHAGELREAA